MSSVLLCSELGGSVLADMLSRWGLELEVTPDGAAIPGSYWDAPEAGLIGHRVYIRGDTPVHSALHESCHTICMDAVRRAELETDAGGDELEESAVCYLQILLADHLEGVGSERLKQDMDSWGYSFRLGSTAAWFDQDAEDAREWLVGHDLIEADGSPTWRLRA